MKDNSEVGTVDEDQRKLFVGGLAQVTARSSSYDHFCDVIRIFMVHSLVQYF